MDSRQAGELMNRVVEDSAKVRQFMEEVFADMFTQSFTILGAMIVMLLMDWKLALLAIAFMPAAVLLVRAFHRKEKRLWRQQWRFNDKVNNRLQDVISGIRVVKSFGQEQRETQRFQEYTERLMQLQRRNERFWATLYPFVTFLLTVGTFFCHLLRRRLRPRRTYDARTAHPVCGLCPACFTALSAFYPVCPAC